MNEQIREMLAQAAALLKQAIEAMTEGDTDRAGELERESEELHEKANGLQKLADKQAAIKATQGALSQPVLPVPLPEGGAGDPTMLIGAGNVGADNGNAETPETVAQKAIYQLRYGEMKPAIKSIVNSLYGNEADYHIMREKQWEGFLHYMRGNDYAITAKHVKASRTLLLTPEYIEAAIQKGWDFPRFKATMVEASDTLVGYIVPVDFQARVIERLRGLTVMRGRAFEGETMRDKVQIPVATGGDSQHTSNVREVWVDETPAAAAAETNATFGLEDIGINTAMSVVPLSFNSLEDAAFNLPNYLTQQFANAAAINEDNSFLIGTGGGQPQGILPGSLNAKSLTEVNSTSAAALTFDGVLALTMNLDTQYKTNAVFIANKATYLIILQLKDGDGAYLWTEQRGNNVAPNATTLRGFEALQQEAMPDVAANAFPIIFGDPEGYAIYDRVGMSVKRYDVNPGENLAKFEMRRRLGGQVVEPWRFVVQKVAA